MFQVHFTLRLNTFEQNSTNENKNWFINLIKLAVETLFSSKPFLLHHDFAKSFSHNKQGFLKQMYISSLLIKIE